MQGLIAAGQVGWIQPDLAALDLAGPTLEDNIPSSSPHGIHLHHVASSAT